MSDRVFIVCPADFVTGGTEALHQLADALNRHGRDRAAMIYRPFGYRHEVPKPFRRYNVRVEDAGALMADSTVVLPETSGDMIDVFPASVQIHMWWLSVDNLFTRSGTDSASHLAAAARRVSRHLYQSDYARAFLESTGLGPTAALSDYLADEYRRVAARPASGRRDDIVAYNPAKGLDQTELVLKELDDSIRTVPLTGMTRNQIRQVLKRAKVYIDFGHHPGKDRIPREAAALGACVLTNRRGAAGHNLDVPIDSEYKVDDETPGFEKAAAAKIRAIMADFGSHRTVFEPYRQWISREQARFLREVDAIYDS